MKNKKMERDLASGVAFCIVSAGCPKVSENTWDITDVWLGDDNYNPNELYFCVAETEQYIRSIGRHRETHRVIASTTGYLKDHPWYKGLFFRGDNLPH